MFIILFNRLFIILEVAFVFLDQTHVIQIYT